MQHLSAASWCPAAAAAVDDPRSSAGGEGFFNHQTEGSRCFLSALVIKNPIFQSAKSNDLSFKKKR